LGTGLDMDILLPASDPNDHWKGMPEFDQKDKTAFRHIVMNFKSNKDAEKFGDLIGQHVTEKTRSMWFPPDEIGTIADKRYKGTK